MATASNIHIGDKVWVPLPAGRLYGTVVEDQGPFGGQGRHLFRVSVPNDPHIPEDYFLREDEIERLNESEHRELQQRLPPEAVADFLQNGGLLAILASNSLERVWLRRDSFGNVTFTFIEGYSVTGGQPAPRYALQGEQIGAAKKDEVVGFIRSFGLTEQQAQRVLKAVGIGH